MTTSDIRLNARSGEWNKTVSQFTIHLPVISVGSAPPSSAISFTTSTNLWQMNGEKAPKKITTGNWAIKEHLFRCIALNTCRNNVRLNEFSNWKQNVHTHTQTGKDELKDRKRREKEKRHEMWSIHCCKTVTAFQVLCALCLCVSILENWLANIMFIQLKCIQQLACFCKLSRMSLQYRYIVLNVSCLQFLRFRL